MSPSVTTSSTLVATLTGTSYSNTLLSPGTTYYYRVLASNSGGNSALSNEDHATTLSATFPLTVNRLYGGPNPALSGETAGAVWSTVSPLNENQDGMIKCYPGANVCTYNYAPDTDVTLKAMPAVADVVFTGWYVYSATGVATKVCEATGTLCTVKTQGMPLEIWASFK
jgi:hypothetical protein